MEIRPQYLSRYLHEIAVDQLVADYSSKGYKVSKNELVGEYEADLVAKKADEVIVFEVKTARMTPDKRRQIAEMSDYVRKHKNYKFLVVLATPPQSKQIDIPNLEHILLSYLVENFPNNINELSSHSRITDVPDATVHELTVTEEGNIVIKGNGTVEVELAYGLKEDRTVYEDTFPFNFDVVLAYNQNRELLLKEAKTIEVDVSSFSE